MLESTVSVYFKYTVYSAQCLANSVNVHSSCVLFQGTTLVAKTLVQTGLHASTWPGTNHAVTHQVGRQMT